MVFIDRSDAGCRIAEHLETLSEPEVVVLGLPRGGVPVAYEVATVLGAPLDVVLVGKLTVPDRPWLTFGAVSEDDVRIIDDDMVAHAAVSEPERLAVTREQQHRLRHSAARYRRDRARLPLDGATAVIIDDALATGASAHAACANARMRGAKRVVFAVPVGATRPLRVLSRVADHVLCLQSRQLFGSIRPWYLDFAPVTDADVCSLLDRATENLPARARVTATCPRT
ncbi:putative phosphoribosyltransferase [Nocardia tenerifensis]|uniref:Putative phosphoribosyltransferase n=1 Tax=Nocardia tenerifensis TaxID=228006 RepID=A0A318JW03_9NOCA|nr:phosphoribosyltransferase family protein [Nocardia tenerifensis]PXX60409.1 putative phosphoribosyltransferase [Nocardia tenerifensis]